MLISNIFVKVNILVVVIIALVQCWDLSGLEQVCYFDNCSIQHVTVYYVRAFLCIKRNSNATKFGPSLIESTWPENFVPVKPKIFPNDLAHATSDCDCNGILQAIQTAIDRNSFLWVLDNGSVYCHPKIIVYNLLKKNAEIQRYTFTEYPGGAFHSIQIYTLPSPSKINFNNSAAYAIISLKRANYLLFYSFCDRKFIKLAFNIVVIIPHQILIHNEHELLIVDTANRLWIGELTRLKPYKNRKNYKTLTITQLGTLLGYTNTLASTATSNTGIFNDYLYYFMPRDGAIVRWNFRRPLTAEGHDVLYLTPLSVTQIFFGAKGSVWVVQEQANIIGDHCTRIFVTHPSPNSIF